jgi:hypothetical protein
MVLVHVLETYAKPEVQGSVFGWVIEFLGGPPAAPVFMFLMGASLAFSRRAAPARGLRRGLWLLFLGYLLNFTRGALPTYLALQAGLCTPEELGPHTPTYELTQADILHLAGLALIILTALRACVPMTYLWVLMSVGVAAVSPLLWGVLSGQPVLDWLLTLLWGVGGEHVAFPVFPWLSYPLIGMAFGHWLRACQDQGTVFRRGTAVGLALVATGTVVILTNPDFHIGDYWRSGPGAVVWIAGFVLVWLGICHAISQRVRKSAVVGVLSYWSENVTVFYFLHWVIIGWGVGIAGFQELSLIPTIISMVVAAVLADGATRLWQRGKRRIEGRTKGPAA